MNERDSEIIYSMMMQEGYTLAQSHEEADLIIFNTCSVRKHAEERVWGKLLEMKGPPSFADAKLSRAATSPPRKDFEEICGDTRPHKKIIGLVGCMAKAHGRAIFKKLPHVDFVCGPSNIYDIPQLLERAKSGKAHLASIGKEKRPLNKKDGIYREEKIRAWVNISYGCNNFCSYCIVPYVRGREVSRPQKNIIDEIKSLVDNGTKEITLLGQNVNSYRLQAAPHFCSGYLDGGSRGECRGTSCRLQVASYRLQVTGDFIQLLEQINKIKGLERIRFMTSHPKDASPELFMAMAQLDKVCEHLHLPMQSGSDRMLRLMKRGYTSSRYLKLIDSVRKIVPGCAITTDIIIGFPSETEQDFKCTYDIIKKIEFDSAFIFKYSPRPFTEALMMEDDVELKVKRQRNQVLLDLQSRITRQKHDKLIGRVENALGLSIAKKSPDCTEDISAGYIKARTRKNYQVVYKGSRHLIGKTLDVRIKGAQDNTLIGEVV
jgi:tRNA-2-methylthio-N6-dimethylallyladenosine synthase